MTNDTTINALSGCTPRRAALFAAGAAIVVLAGAFVMQYGFGIEPCELCHLQRIPYYVAIPVALLTACLPNSSRTIRLGLAMLALIFFVNACFGAYHAGVEWKFWAGPAACSGPSGAAADPNADLLQQMAQASAVSCSEAAFRFLGLSLAGWNVLVSLALAACMLVTLGCRRLSRKRD